jgi:ribosomal protein S12
VTYVVEIKHPGKAWRRLPGVKLTSDANVRAFNAHARAALRAFPGAKYRVVEVRK